MTALRPLVVLILSVLPSLSATFGTVVQHAQPLSDLVLDDARKRLYLVNSGTSQVEVYSTTTNPPRLSATIKTDSTPLAAAMSRSGKYLYVTCYAASSLDIIDLTTASFTTRSLTLGAPPEAVAVGFDEKVLVSTIGTALGQDILITYDPNGSATSSLQAIVNTPPAPTAPQVPPPNGTAYLASHSRLAATPDGRTIIGVNELANTTRTVYVYDAASSTVLSARNITGLSPVLAVSPDGARFFSGPTLFDTATLSVLAQQNTANSPYTFPNGTSFTTFNTQTNQGGAVFAPDGSALLAAYNIVPLESPSARSNASQLLVNSPSNLLIELGIQLPETLSGKIVITSDSATAYAISQSGFIVLPMGTLTQVPIAAPDTNAALLAFDQCGVVASQNSAVIPVRNVGGSRMTATAQLLQTVVGGSTATSPAVSVASKSYGADVTARFNSAAARSVGTVTPDLLLIQSPEAVNLAPNVRIFQNDRNAESRGTIIPVDMGSSNTGLTDMLVDTARQRLYIANPGLNRIEVFDMQKQQFTTPVGAGQLPRSMAFGIDTNRLYVANSGGETISIVDLTKQALVGQVKFPAISFNSTVAVTTPQVIASTQFGPMVLMSDSTLWRIIGDTLTLFPLNAEIFGTGARTIAGPAQAMVASPEGSFLLLLAGTGTAYLYSASVDDFVTGKQVLPTPVTGYFGPIAAGPNGQYFLVDDQVLNSALTGVGQSAGRPVSAVTALNAQTFARFSMPPRASATTAPTDAGVIEIVNATTQQTNSTGTGLEGPLTAVATGQRANISGRTMALDASGSTAYVITTSGLSIIPIGAPPAATAPQVLANGVVSTASMQSAIASGGLASIFGKNLAAAATGSGTPLPSTLGGACVTLNNAPLPLISSSATQINVQIPPSLASGRYPLVVRSIANQAASSSLNVTVSKYAPAVFVDAQGPLIFHQNGDRVDHNHPGTRDEPLTLYATGLGPTTGGTVTAGAPSPSNPLAVTGPVKLYFGNPAIKQAEVIVDWSGLQPGTIGVYQINCRIPGAHVNGDKLPVTLKIGGATSPTTGPEAPFVSVQ